jgi:hypothetical protein
MTYPNKQKWRESIATRPALHGMLEFFKLTWNDSICKVKYKDKVRILKYRNGVAQINFNSDIKVF